MQVVAVLVREEPSTNPVDPRVPPRNLQCVSPAHDPSISCLSTETFLGLLVAIAVPSGAVGWKPSTFLHHSLRSLELRPWRPAKSGGRVRSGRTVQEFQPKRLAPKQERPRQSNIPNTSQDRQRDRTPDVQDGKSPIRPTAKGPGRPSAMHEVCSSALTACAWSEGVRTSWIRSPED